MYRIPFLELKAINSRYIDDIANQWKNTIDSGWYINGSQKQEFEDKLAEYNKIPFVLGTSNGYDSLRLIFKSLIIIGKLNIGDHIIVPSNSFVASALAISENGLIPVFVDKRKEGFSICENDLTNKINSKVKAILLVHLYGQICFSNKLKEVIDKHNLMIIEDNAQAIGAEWNGIKSGGIGIASGYSFYPGKNLGAMGDAGAIGTKERELFNVMKSLSNYGSSDKYTHDFLGDNCRLDEIQAAVLNVKLPFLNDENEKRRSIAYSYNNGINNDNILLPTMPAEILSHVWHLYVIQVSDRNGFQEYMQRHGIETMIHYPKPIHKQKAYRDYNNQKLINSEKIQNSIVSIPLNSALNQEDIDYIITVMNQYQVN